MSTTVAPPHRLHHPLRLVAVLLALAALVTIAGVVAVTSGGPSADGPARGLDTTCGDFVRMTDEQRGDVIRESGRWKSDPDAGVDYYLEICPQGDAAAQLENFQG